LLFLCKWLNAGCFRFPVSSIEPVEKLGFVESVDISGTYIRESPPSPQRARKALAGQQSGALGPCLKQLGIPGLDSLRKARNIGLPGQGLVIGVFDASFNLSHSSLTHIRSKVIADSDFVDDDNDLVDPKESTSHGSAVLSIIGGMDSGVFAGPAHCANFILARTENTDKETHIEEYNWVAALQWAESLGVDIVNTSLGYRYDFSWTVTYIHEDSVIRLDKIEYDLPFKYFDGKTLPASRAASVAADKGILLCMSAGNTGELGMGSIQSPADAFDVLSVGSVDIRGNYYFQSSRGPTYDDRIKPDVMACGIFVPGADTRGVDMYTEHSGTSFASPLIAGGCALLMQAVRTYGDSLSVKDIISCVKNSATNAHSPNNYMGWGIPDFLNAFLDKAFVQLTLPDQGFENIKIFPTPVRGESPLYFDFSERYQRKAFTVSIYTLSGDMVWKKTITGPVSEFIYRISWDGKNTEQAKVAPGIYFCLLQFGSAKKLEKIAVIR
jgi:subtilisin family serine protease